MATIRRGRGRKMLSLRPPFGAFYESVAEIKEPLLVSSLLSSCLLLSFRRRRACGNGGRVRVGGLGEAFRRFHRPL